MPFTRRTLALALLTLAIAGGVPIAHGQTVHRTAVTFVLTNDIYLMNEQVMPDGKARGGFARLAAVVKAERAKGGHVVFAHAGDTLSPSLMSSFDRGAHIITLTNMLGVDAFAPGNHEFDFGKATFLQRMRDANFPLYAANLRGPDGLPVPGFNDRAMLAFDGVRIGITGATHDDTPRTSSPEDLRFLPAVGTVKAQTQALRAEGADFVVAVIHADREQAVALQTARAGDLILTGHTHDLFINFDGLSAVVESGADASYVAAVDVAITVEEGEGRRVATWWPQFRIIDTAMVEPDPAVAAVVARYGAELTREMDVPLGSTAVELDSRNAAVRTREAAIGNLFADAMRISTRSDAAVINGGGMRSGKVYAPGTAITRKDILAELPFSNRVVVVEMPGRELSRAIEYGLAQMPIAGGRFPQVSGLKVEYDLNRPPGARVMTMAVSDAPLDADKVYRVAVLDFLARGGDGYDMFRDAKRVTPDNDAPLLANAVMVHIRHLGTVRTQIEGRMIAR